ncbi:hypothetical protein ABT063_19255 [Streptomyces sp. NPDC002838]
MPDQASRHRHATAGEGIVTVLLEILVTRLARREYAVPEPT